VKRKCVDESEYDRMRRSTFSRNRELMDPLTLATRLAMG
jgi:hypothetical protein